MYIAPAAAHPRRDPPHTTSNTDNPRPHPAGPDRAVRPDSQRLITPAFTHRFHYVSKGKPTGREMAAPLRDDTKASTLAQHQHAFPVHSKRSAPCSGTPQHPLAAPTPTAGALPTAYMRPAGGRLLSAAVRPRRFTHRLCAHVPACLPCMSTMQTARTRMLHDRVNPS